MNLPLLKKELSNMLNAALRDFGKRIVLVTHVNPDGDAIGSALGFFGFLKELGFELVDLVVPNDYADFLKWMPGNENIFIASENQSQSDELIENADVLFCLDFNHPDRAHNLKHAINRSKALKIVIDHHPQPALEVFDIVVSDVSVSSTAELIFIVINSLNKCEVINKNIATCLFAGIITDTGSFSYSNNNPQTYLIAAFLISRGVDALSVNRNIYDTYSEDRIRLLGYCLKDKLKVLPNRKVAYICLTMDELKLYNYREGDTEGIVNYALSIDGIQLAAFFMERDDIIKISFRSRRLIDVNVIARKYFNGGGHVNAAGGMLTTDMKDAVGKFEDLFTSGEYL